MNSFVERLNRFIRRETLDHFLLFSEKADSKYVEYYTTKRMHQGIDTFSGVEIQERFGIIKKMKILSGLHHHYYYRSSA